MNPVLFILYYSGLLGIFSIALHRLKTALSIRDLRRLSVRENFEPTSFVTLQIPVFNEKYVIGRILESILDLQYPKHLLEIQVLDDSTDETSSLIREQLPRLRAQGFTVQHLQRQNRSGYKAGALHEGLLCARGEFIAIFDADFIVPKDFLIQTLSEFFDPWVACVQGRWTFINEHRRALTKLQATLLHAHFQVEQPSRASRGLFIHFNGTAGVWRKAAVLDAGSFTDQSLTEDLDVSYRAQLRGWRIRYLPEVTASSELPETFLDFKRQQSRWATGSIQSLRNLFVPILRSSLSWPQKIEAILHLARHGSYLCTFLVLATLPWVVSQRPRGDLLNYVDALLFFSSFGMILFYFLRAPMNRGGLLRSIAAAWIGVALTPSMTLAVARGFAPRSPEFVRTPKGRGYAFGFSKLDLWDGAIALYFWICLLKFFMSEFWVSKPMLWMTGLALGLPFFISLSKIKIARGAP